MPTCLIVDDSSTMRSIARKMLRQLGYDCLEAPDGAAALGGKLATLCQGWQPPAELDQKLAAKIEAACEDKPFYGKPAMVKRRVPQRQAAPPPVSGFRQF